MKLRSIDRRLFLEFVEQRAKKEKKDANDETVDELAELNEKFGATEITSTLFGPEAGRVKYSTTRKKKVVEFNLASADELREWVMDNQDAAMAYVLDHAQDFGREWFEKTGEVPEGVSRVEYEEPAKRGPAKLYGFNPEVIEEKLGGSLLAGMSGLLLGDGDE